MNLRSLLRAGVAVCAVVTLSFGCYADTLVLKDGSSVQNCFARDEGIHFLVWEKMEDVGTPKVEVIPRSQVKEFKVERDSSWDAHPDLPDLSVTFIEMTPKLAGLHGNMQYDPKFGRPKPGGAKAIVDTGDRGYIEPEETVKNLKLHYTPGEEITLTAHVRNIGFKSAAPFDYTWQIDGKEIGKGRCAKAVKEMDEVTFPIKWKWQDGFHNVTFKVDSREQEIASANNEATDPLWGFAMYYIVSTGRAKAWHQFRSAAGTFAFDDYYRWHIDIMNKLFAASIFPSAPDGIKARVRLDRILYTDDVDKATTDRVAPDGIYYYQGGWIWSDGPEEKQTGKYVQTDIGWRCNTEWSLPHELGHQLGLIDWYTLDYGPRDETHRWPDNNEIVSHMENHPIAMMHSHGPQVFNEVDTDYLNTRIDKPSGYFGDHVYAIPKENFLKIVDVNGIGVPGAKVEVFQRGTVVDPNGQPGEDHGVKYFPSIENGDYPDQPISKDPLMVGTTDEFGMFRMANRPVMEIKSLNGFYRQANPFGNIAAGPRCLLLAKVTKFDRPCFYWLEVYDFNVAWFRGLKDRFEITLKTPYGSPSSPLPPRNLKVTPLDNTHVKVSWDAPAIPREQQYLDRSIGFRVYRRVSSQALNDRPWFPVATLGPDAREFTIDLSQRPEDGYQTVTNRFAVSSLGELSFEGEMVEAPLTTGK